MSGSEVASARQRYGVILLGENDGVEGGGGGAWCIVILNLAPPLAPPLIHSRLPAVIHEDLLLVQGAGGVLKGRLAGRVARIMWALLNIYLL